jgi:DNA-binding NtrC family response regulator
MNAQRTIVIASADRGLLGELTNIVKRMKLEPICTSTVSQCREILAQQTSALVFCDRTFEDGDYRDLITAARETVIPKAVASNSRLRM